MKKLISLVLCLTIIAMLATTFTAFAADTSVAVTDQVLPVNKNTASGSITWSWDPATKTLSFAGTGALPTYMESAHDTLILYSDSPYYVYKDVATKIVIGSGITKIPQENFRNFGKVTSVVLPEGLTDIGYHAFFNCDSLTSVTFPSTLRTIGSLAFASNTWQKGLTGELVIPGSVTSIGGSAFQNTSISKITIENGTDALNLLQKAFINIVGADLKLIIQRDAVVLGTDAKPVTALSGLFGSSSYCSADETTVYCNSNVKAVFDAVSTADANNYFKKVVVLPNGISKFGVLSGITDGYWAYADGTLHIYGNGTDTTSYWNAIQPWFDFKDSITKVVFHEGITNVVKNFGGRTDTANKNDLKNLTEVVLPSTLTDIGQFAFGGCPKLSKISYSNSNETIVTPGFPEGLISIGQQSFQNCPLEAFKNNALIIPASVTTIGNTAFYGGNVTTVSNINFAKGSKLETIGDNAFYGKWSVTTVEIPSTVSSIGKSAFSSNATSNLNVYFEGAKPATIGANAFARTGSGATVKVICYQDGFATSDFGSLSYLTVQKSSPVLASGLTLTVGDNDVTAAVSYRAPAAMSENQDYILIIAAYTDDNTLVDVNIDTTGTIEADTTHIENGTISKTINKVSGATKYKAFFWDSLAECTPITEAK